MSTTSSTASSLRQEFLRGARDTIPLIAGAIPFGIIFGALSVNAGLTPGAALGMSLFVVFAVKGAVILFAAVIDAMRQRIMLRG